MMKRTKYPIHPDFQKWANMNSPLHKATIPVGGSTIRALWYCPKDVGEHAPCRNYHDSVLAHHRGTGHADGDPIH